MALLKEIPSSRVREEPKRRWFQNDYFDLVVWTRGDGKISGFQLCYDRGPRERALVWTLDAGYSHHRVDDGEGDPWKNQSPVLTADGAFPATEILQRFGVDAAGIDAVIRDFVSERVAVLAHQSR